MMAEQAKPVETQTEPEEKPIPLPAPPTKPAEPAEPEPEKKDVEQFKTREWLRSIGVALRDVPPVREPARIQEPERVPQRIERPTSDVEVMQNLLREGDDARFIEGMFEGAERRIMGKLQRQNRDADLGMKIDAYVGKVAPE